jgi:hypothetical protein
VDLLARLVVDDAERYELPRILILGTSVNKGEKMSRWGNTGRDEGSVPIMGINSERRQPGGRM